MGKIAITVVEARGSRNKQLAWVTGPFVRIICNDKKYKTVVAKDPLSPAWGETFSFKIADENSTQIRLEVWNKGVVSDDLLGYYDLSLRGLTRGIVKDEWYILEKSKSFVELRLRILAVDFGLSPNAEDEWKVTTDIRYDPVREAMENNIQRPGIKTPAGQPHTPSLALPGGKAKQPPPPPPPAAQSQYPPPQMPQSQYAPQPQMQNPSSGQFMPPFPPAPYPAQPQYPPPQMPQLQYAPQPQMQNPSSGQFMPPFPPTPYPAQPQYPSQMPQPQYAPQPQMLQPPPGPFTSSYPPSPYAAPPGPYPQNLAYGGVPPRTNQPPYGCYNMAQPPTNSPFPPPPPPPPQSGYRY